MLSLKQYKKSLIYIFYIRITYPHTGCPAIIIIAAYLFALAATASALYAQQIKLLKV